MHKIKDFSGASDKTEYFWPEKSWHVTLKRLCSCNPCSSALGDRSVLGNLAQRGSQASKAISHTLLERHRTSIDANILQWEEGGNKSIFGEMGCKT